MAKKTKTKFEDPSTAPDEVNVAPPPTHVMFKAEIPIPIKRVLELEPKLIMLVRNFMLTEKIGPYEEALKDMDNAVQGSSGND